MLSQKLENRPLFKWGLVIACVALVAVVFVLFFVQRYSLYPYLAVDWQQIYPGINDGYISYAEAPGLRNTPWGLLPLLPLGLFSMPASWGLLNFITLTVLILSVPRHPKRWMLSASILLLLINNLTIHMMGDGNLEWLVISGTLLLVYGYRVRHSPALVLGILLVTAKPQAASLLIAGLGLYILLTWPVREWFKLLVMVASVMMLSVLLFGAGWLDNMLGLEQRGSIMDVGLWSGMLRAGLPQLWMIVLWGAVLVLTLVTVWRSERTISRTKAAFLMAASLLLAPYAAGLALLSPLAVGIIPFFQKRPLPGLLLIMMTNVPLFFFTRAITVSWGAWYVTLELLIVWLVMGWQIVRSEIRIGE